MKSLIIVLVIMTAFFTNGSIDQADDYKLKEGDLLFQQLDCGKYCDAINKVTYGVNGIDFNHVGVLLKGAKGGWVVLEAVSEGVQKLPLEDFLDKSRDAGGQPKVIAGRLIDGYRYIVEKVVRQGDQFVGKPYDAVYDIDDDTYYCSELVYHLYRDKFDQPIFELSPMTFKDPETNDFFKLWVEYFEDLGVPIPEGDPGLNPGSISRSDKLDIYYPYSAFD